MIRTLSIIENNVQPDPPVVKHLVGGVSKQIFPDMRKQNNKGVSDELVQRLVQNCSVDQYLYLSFGIDECDNVENFHCIVGPLQQRDVSSDRAQVYGYCAANMDVATEVRWRQTNLGGLQSIGH